MLSKKSAVVFSRLFGKQFDKINSKSYNIYINKCNSRLKYENDGFSSEYLGFSHYNDINIENIEQLISEIKDIEKQKKDEEYYLLFII